MDMEKGKKKTRKRLSALERLHQDCAHPEPGHQAAADANSLSDGYTDAMNQCKSAAEMAAPATAAPGGGGSPSVGDYGNQRAGTGRRRVAVGSRDLQQQPATVFSAILSTLRSNPYSYVGQSGFNGAFSGTDSPVDAPGDQVTVHGYDAAGRTGTYSGMGEVDIAPRGDDGYHQHRDSATAPNGTHSLGNVTSTAVKSRVEIMREALFGS
jgi:hypothetical protein